MARSEARVFTSIWSDPDFVALSPDVQRMYLFLLSQPDLSFCGRLVLSTRWWAQSAAGLTPKAVCEALGALEKARFIVIDQQANELLIRSLIRRDHVLKSPKLIKPLGGALAEVRSPQLRGVLMEELRRGLDVGEEEGWVHASLGETLQSMIKFLETAGKYPIRYPIGKGTGKGTGMGTQYPQGKGKGVKPPSPSPKNPPSGGEGGGRGTRIPADFALTEAMAAWAQANAPHADAGYQTAQFTDYWAARTGQIAVKRDWVRAWYTWMRKAERDATERARVGGRKAAIQQQEFVDWGF